VRYAKVGHHVQVLVGTRFFHAQVTEVTDQDTVEVSIKGATPVAAARLAGPPRWQVNRFET
jgi:hypothetical protein